MRKSTELMSVMKRLMVAVATQDSATAQGLVANRPETLLVGSAEAEWLYGQEAYEVIGAQLSAMPEYERTFHRLEAYEDGATGWGAADSTVKFPNGVIVRSRSTFVFRLEAGVWKVVQWHSSIPRSDVHGYEVPQSLSDLVDSLDPDTEQVLRERLHTETVTLLISDIEGSTDRGVELGDDIWGRVIQRHFGDLERIANAHDGTVVKTMGDGALIAFDSAVSGARAAIEIQRLATRPETSGGIRVRIGIHTGDAIHSDEDYFGYTVNKTARLASAATGGNTLVSEVVHGLLADKPEFVLHDRVSLNLKGLPGTHPAYSLSAA